MRKRSQARELALQILYQLDITHEPFEIAVRTFWKMEANAACEEDVRGFAEELVKGVLANLKPIDDAIARYATNWELDRMAVVDRNILRLSSYELLLRDDIPPKVSINEAVELAKKYSGAQAGKFVNGILDKIKSEKKS
ncbi:MAG: transcription antitermination factor NusB [Deltaproteobacteria bacterium]